MRPIDQMEVTLASKLGIDRGRLNTLVMHLRKNGLYTRGVSGHPMPEPLASDATNLMLAVLSGVEAKDVAETVARLRALPGNTSLPVSGLIARRMLGDVVDGILDQLVKRGEVAIEQPAESLRATCSLTAYRSALGTAFRVRLRAAKDPRLEWNAWYEQPNDELAHQLRKNGDALAPDRIIEERLSFSTFGAVAVSLAGDDKAAQEALSWVTASAKGLLSLINGPHGISIARLLELDDTASADADVEQPSARRPHRRRPK